MYKQRGRELMTGTEQTLTVPGTSKGTPTETERVLSPDDSVKKLIEDSQHRERQLWRSLNRWWRHLIHPVTALHLEQIASHIHSILFYLPQSDTLRHDELARESLRSVLDKLEYPWRLSRDSAWELAGEFERQLIELGDDTYLYTLLKDKVGSDEETDSTRVQRVPTLAKWDNHFSGEELRRLRRDYLVLQL
jgi:hypothetical protein